MVTKIALKYGNTSSFTNYTQIKGINSIIYSWIVGEINTTYIGDKYWSSILTTAKYGKDANTNADNKKYFLWGCALHILSDMFAHGTKIKSNSKVGAEITHTTRADDATYVRNRYDVAVKAVDYSLAYMTMNIPGDYWDVIYALMDKYNNTFAKIKLLDFVNKSSGGGLSNTYLSPVQRASCNP